MKKQNNLGFTLVELIIVIAIVGIVATLAIPSFQGMLERNRLKEVAEGLRADIQWMRTNTIKRSCNLQVTFNSAPPWNYTIFRVDGTCGCPVGGGNCTDITVNASQFTGITMSNNPDLADDDGVLFDFRRGDVSVGNVGNTRFDSTNYHVKIVVSINGRVRICNIAGEDGLPAYEDC